MRRLPNSLLFTGIAVVSFTAGLIFRDLQNYQDTKRQESASCANMGDGVRDYGNGVYVFESDSWPQNLAKFRAQHPQTNFKFPPQHVAFGNYLLIAESGK